jgi:ribosomal protein S27E
MYGHMDKFAEVLAEEVEGRPTMANVKVTCPHCGHQTWVREHYNDPCQHCGKTVPDPYIK